MFCTFTLVFSKLCMQCSTWMYFVAPRFSASQYVAKILLLFFFLEMLYCSKTSVIKWPRVKPQQSEEQLPYVYVTPVPSFHK